MWKLEIWKLEIKLEIGILKNYLKMEFFLKKNNNNENNND